VIDTGGMVVQTLRLRYSRTPVMIRFPNVTHLGAFDECGVSRRIHARAKTTEALMKIVNVIARILLGLIFLVFGLNGFLNFFPTPPLAGVAGAFIGALISSHYVYLVCGVQLIAGVLLLINRFVPLALAMLAPVIANILAYHLTMQLSGLPLALFTTILWMLLMWRFRAYFTSLFVQKA
jgi:putative oxidoreductase